MASLKRASEDDNNSVSVRRPSPPARPSIDRPGTAAERDQTTTALELPATNTIKSIVATSGSQPVMQLPSPAQEGQFQLPAPLLPPTHASYQPRSYAYQFAPSTAPVYHGPPVYQQVYPVYGPPPGPQYVTAQDLPVGMTAAVTYGPPFPQFGHPAGPQQYQQPSIPLVGPPYQMPPPPRYGVPQPEIIDLTQDQYVATRSPNELMLDQAILSLNEEELQSLLKGAAMASPSLQGLLIDKLHAKQHRERTRVIDFNRYSKRVWHTLNDGRYDDLRESQKFGKGGDIWNEAAELIQEIREQVKAESSFGTKKSALVTYRKIGKSLCLMDRDQIYRSIRNIACMDRYVEEGMQYVFECMSDEEWLRMRGPEGVEWRYKMNELLGLCNADEMLVDYKTLIGFWNEFMGVQSTGSQDDQQEVGVDVSEGL